MRDEQPAVQHCCQEEGIESWWKNFQLPEWPESLCRAVGVGTSDENDRDEAGIQLSRRVGDEEEDD